MALGVAASAVACSSPAEPTSSAAAAPAKAISGSLGQWQDAVCKDGQNIGATHTRITDDDSTCLPVDGDGAVAFSHFDSTSSRDTVLAWAGPSYVAQTMVDDRPLVAWTPAGQSSDLEPLKSFGFTVSQASFVKEQPGAVPNALNPSRPEPPSAATSIPANADGYVVVQTASGQTLCMVQTTYIGCQTAGNQWPARPGGGGRYHGVKVNADGTAQWVDGNLGADNPVTLGNQTYQALGWTITTVNAETRFTNTATGHGAIVSEQGVQRF